MKYRAGFKVQLEEDESIRTRIYPVRDIRYARHGHILITLTMDGLLTVHAGYASDLASGPTFNTKSSRRGAVFHDALYELMRQELLALEWRVPVDHLLIAVVKIDGMYAWRAWYWTKGLHLADGKHALPENKKPILEAP